jgi:hypothetical protein
VISTLVHWALTIEVGFVTDNQSLGCCLIKPIDSWLHWSEEAERIHGIQRSLLKDKGKNLSWFAHWLNNNLYGLTVYSGAWVKKEKIMDAALPLGYF